MLAIASCGDEERAAAPAATTSTSTVVREVTPPRAPPVAAEVPIAAPAPAARPRKPTIIRKFIPYGAARKQQMSAYSKRHYGVAGYKLTDPRVIVEHFTVNDSVQATYNTFAPNQPDPELHELPGVCSHFVIGKTGRIYQLVPLAIRCRHTVGLNDRSFGIEHVGRSDRQILGNRRQLTASLRLTAWLRCRHDIGVRNVLGHNESLSSPYHHELVEKLKTQTHGDFKKASMQVYRRKLRARPCR
ncbi:MAG: peptidoglycan recognition protein family protein [Solirubrobacteraceae bacterium]